MKFKSIEYKRILIHVFFWITVLFVNLFLYASGYEYTKILLSLLTTLPLDIFATYITLYFFIPKFLLHKRYLEFSVYFLISVFIIVTAERAINLYYVYPKIYSEPIENIPSFWSVGIFFLAINIYKIVALATAIKLIKTWYQNRELQSQLQNQNLKSELALLRNQINPHFLFNTLNNIDALITKDQNKASDAIIKLSEIMRYMLYEANEDTVSFDKEIEYLKSYVSLQLLRMKDKDFVEFITEAKNRTFMISPMLFITFIENAFKHGRKGNISPGISIRFKTIKNKLIFECENYCNETKLQKDKTKGIGLINVKRRLDLLYPEKYVLDIRNEHNKFKAQLILEF